MIPELALNVARTALRAFSERVPADLRDKLQYEIDVRDDTVVLVESRPIPNSPRERKFLDVARFVFKPANATWMLMWCDRDDQWHPYKHLESEPNFQRLVDEVMADPTGIFFG